MFSKVFWKHGKKESEDMAFKTKFSPTFSPSLFHGIAKDLIYLDENFGINELLLNGLEPCTKIKTLDYTVWRRGFYLLSVADFKGEKFYYQGVIWVQCPRCQSYIIPKRIGDKLPTYLCPSCGFRLFKKVKKICNTVFDVITTNNCFQCWEYHSLNEFQGLCNKFGFAINVDDALKTMVCEHIKPIGV